MFFIIFTTLLIFSSFDPCDMEYFNKTPIVYPNDQKLQGISNCRYFPTPHKIPSLRTLQHQEPYRQYQQSQYRGPLYQQSQYQKTHQSLFQRHRPKLCINGPNCRFLHGKIGCRFYHPPSHINNKGIKLLHNNSFLNKYTMCSFLGQGTFGEVHKVKCLKTGKYFAVKKTTPKYKEKTRTEFKLQKDIHDSPDHIPVNICEPFELFEEKEASYVVLEYISGGSLSRHIKTKLSEKNVKNYMWQITNGLHICHSNNIAHRDLKPCNILFDSISGCCKLADFGNSIKISSDEQVSEWVTTIIYCPPEVLMVIPWGSKKYDPFKLDIWSLGIIMLELLLENIHILGQQKVI